MEYGVEELMNDKVIPDRVPAGFFGYSNG